METHLGEPRRGIHFRGVGELRTHFAEVGAHMGGRGTHFVGVGTQVGEWELISGIVGTPLERVGTSLVRVGTHFERVGTDFRGVETYMG